VLVEARWVSRRAAATVMAWFRLLTERALLQCRRRLEVL
jgi:hypothetical protein